MLTPRQLPEYFPDLRNPEIKTALALVHSRFSTNTFPSWMRAHPYRYIAHNGEINTLRGNVNWMHARQALLASRLFGDDWAKILPIIDENGSDSAMFDNCLEFLHLSGRSLPHAMMMMIPEPWAGHRQMSEEKKAFYEYHACLMEPWDGPASIAFTDGVRIGAVLDRNGLRPSRYYVTKDDLVIMASEVGVLPVARQPHRHEGPAAAGEDVPGRHGAGADHSRRGDQGGDRHAQPYRRGSTRTWCISRTCPPPTPGRRGAGDACCSASRPSATPTRICAAAGADGDQRRRGGRLHGQRHAAGRPVGASRSCSTTISSSSSPR